MKEAKKPNQNRLAVLLGVSVAVVGAAAVLGVTALSRREPETPQAERTSQPTRGVTEGATPMARSAAKAGGEAKQALKVPRNMSDAEMDQYIRERFNTQVILDAPPKPRQPGDPPFKTSQEKVAEYVKAEFEERLEKAKASSPEARAEIERELALDRRRQEMLQKLPAGHDTQASSPDSEE